MTARRALELGTIDGARSMGVDDKVGSLKPGKRADSIAIGPDTLSMAVVTDPAHAVLEGTGRRTSTPWWWMAASSSAAASSLRSTRRKWSRRHAPHSPACANARSGGEHVISRDAR